MAVLNASNKLLILLGINVFNGVDFCVNLEGVVGVRWVSPKEVVEVVCDNGRTVVSFDVFLRPIGTRLALLEDSSSHLSSSGPGGRTVRWQSAERLLELGMTSWESVPEIEFGPGWATVRFRCARLLGDYLEWKDSSGARRHAQIYIDPEDPISQRAFIYGLQEGQAISIRHVPCVRTFPSFRWTAWKEIVVPMVELSGERPTVLLP